MQALNALRSANLLIVQLPRSGHAAATAAARIAADAPRSDWRLPTQLSPIAFDSIYSVNHVDANELKINLFERTGKAFGLDINDFADAGKMADAIQSMMSAMDAKDAENLVKTVEKELGLDKLGVSFRDLMEAMREPGGTKDRELLAALNEQAGLGDPSRRPNMKLDDIGLYSF